MTLLIVFKSQARHIVELTVTGVLNKINARVLRDYPYASGRSVLRFRQRGMSSMAPVS